MIGGSSTSFILTRFSTQTFFFRSLEHFINGRTARNKEKIQFRLSNFFGGKTPDLPSCWAAVVKNEDFIFDDNI